MTSNKASIDFWCRTLWTFIWIFFSVVLTVIPISNGVIHAQELVSVKVGAGNIQIKTKNDQFHSDSKLDAWHAGLGLDLEKEEYPLRIVFRGSYFSTGDEVENWISPGSSPMNQSRLEAHGVALEAHGYFTGYSRSFRNGGLIFSPYLGGGLVARRLKLEREGFHGSMFPLYPLISNTQYYLGNQSIVEVGFLPSIGSKIEFPGWDLSVNLNLGWAFLGINSGINYHVSFAGSDAVIYPYLVHTSGSSFEGKIDVKKDWESFSVEIGWQWEKTEINDKSVFFFTSGTGPDRVDFYLPFPEYEITQTLGKITLIYLF